MEVATDGPTSTSPSPWQVTSKEVLQDWTRQVLADLDAVELFDLPSGDTIYRVFLLPGCLQLDLSFTPEPGFGAAGPRFRLLFGRAHARPFAEPPSAQDLFGWAVAYARDARACVERRRWWQAEYCVSAIRDNALALACRRRGLPARFGRGYDDLPAEVLEPFQPAIVRSLSREGLLEALGAAVEGLLRESAEVAELAEKAGPRLRELLAAEPATDSHRTYANHPIWVIGPHSPGVSMVSYSVDRPVPRAGQLLSGWGVRVDRGGVGSDEPR